MFDVHTYLEVDVDRIASPNRAIIYLELIDSKPSYMGQAMSTRSIEHLDTVVVE
jgi:hypothetical protein